MISAYGKEAVYTSNRPLDRARRRIPFFNGKENERIPGKREEEHYDTDDRKLEFLQRYGWLTDDDDVRAYSAKYKPKK